jgi:multidrug efflux system membrane fusion protein
MDSMRISRSLALVSLLALVWISGCARSSKVESADRPAVPVRVAAVLTKTVPVQVRAIGTGEAYSTVSIKAQVNAELMEVHFQEGQFVKKGDLLFSLDRRPFDAALAQAQANLARDQAQGENAGVQAQRYAKLFQEGVAAKEQYDQFQANADALKAAVQADRAAVDYAKLQLQYCFIYSPLDGRTGTLMLHVGNLTKANDVPILVVINQISPIYVEFSPSEDVLPEVKKYMARGRLKVEATPLDAPEHPQHGTLSFIDNAVDFTTGTIRLKGVFPNEDRRLWPGEFVNVVLTLTEEANVVVVPAQAVQTGQDGQYVFVVKPDQTVDSRPVQVERTVGNEAIIARGLQAGETVVTDGQIGLVPGARVKPVGGS